MSHSSQGDGLNSIPAVRHLRWLEVLIRIERWAGGALTGMMAAILLVGVHFRYVLGSPLVWTEEISRFILVAVSFIAAASVSARSGHVSLTPLEIDDEETHFFAKTKKAIPIVTSLCTAIAIVALLPAGAKAAIDSLGTVSPGAQVSRAWLFGPPVVGLSLISFHTFVNLYVALRHGELAAVRGETSAPAV